MPMSTGIHAFISEGLLRLPDVELRLGIEDFYNSDEGQRSFSCAEELFNRLTSASWSKSQLRRFLWGWGATHGTSAFVSGLMIRLQREAIAAGPANPESRLLLHCAAAEIGEIISEDTGVDGVSHMQLFVQLANSLIGDDSWRLDENSMPACNRFRGLVRQRRLKDPIEKAILTTMASECWNIGEYSYFNSLIRRWMTEQLGLPSDYADAASTYVRIHTGDTELGHFLHAVEAWKYYCEATGREPSIQTVVESFRDYQLNLLYALEELTTDLVRGDLAPVRLVGANDEAVYN